MKMKLFGFVFPVILTISSFCIFFITFTTWRKIRRKSLKVKKDILEIWIKGKKCLKDNQKEYQFSEARMRKADIKFNLTYKKQTSRECTVQRVGDIPGNGKIHSIIPKQQRSKNVTHYLLSCSILLDISYLAWVCKQSLDKTKTKTKNTVTTTNLSLDSSPTQEKLSYC